MGDNMWIYKSKHGAYIELKNGDIRHQYSEKRTSQHCCLNNEVQFTICSNNVPDPISRWKIDRNIPFLWQVRIVCTFYKYLFWICHLIGKYLYFTTIYTFPYAKWTITTLKHYKGVYVLDIAIYFFRTSGYFFLVAQLQMSKNK